MIIELALVIGLASLAYACFNPIGKQRKTNNKDSSEVNPKQQVPYAVSEEKINEPENCMNVLERQQQEMLERRPWMTEQGEFWADRIKKLHDKPDKRLALALENIPLPSAFREAAISLRSIIRKKRKLCESYDEELKDLYWVAAINSFCIPYDSRSNSPGFNVAERVPRELLVSFAYEYKSLGYNELELLNKTDVKWLIEAWGEPESHTTLNKIHHEVWVHFADEVIEDKKQRLNAIRTMIKRT